MKRPPTGLYSHRTPAINSYYPPGLVVLITLKRYCFNTLRPAKKVELPYFNLPDYFIT